MSFASSLPNLVSFPEERQLVGLSNWAVFRDHLRSIAHATGLTGYLDSTIVTPSPSQPPKPSTSKEASSKALESSTPSPVPASTPINSRNPSVKEWELRDGRLAGIIYQNIKDPRSIGVTEVMLAHKMWSCLTREYDTSLAAAQSLAKEHIQQFRSILKQLEALCKAASDVGCKVPDEDLRSRFLTSLSSDYLWVIQNHGAHPYPELKRVLQEYDLMVESARPLSANTLAPNALAVPFRPLEEKLLGQGWWE
ncbi:hypothetical protein F5050DRAFT_1714637 [Lentinula boryana]|uniref:Uncharacterized protein n=1 Tax=Lentinula boryana TaxID=40481 RepID=A0ABQ8Q528_9AGAR|nr:hypothetical protein F5050DRAFT_1714637 [Lentinula boryana]